MSKPENLKSTSEPQAKVPSVPATKSLVQNGAQSPQAQCVNTAPSQPDPPSGTLARTTDATDETHNYTEQTTSSTSMDNNGPGATVGVDRVSFSYYTLEPIVLFLVNSIMFISHD